MRLPRSAFAPLAMTPISAIARHAPFSFVIARHAPFSFVIARHVSAEAISVGNTGLLRFARNDTRGCRGEGHGEEATGQELENNMAICYTSRKFTPIKPISLVPFGDFFVYNSRKEVR